MTSATIIRRVVLVRSPEVPRLEEEAAVRPLVASTFPLEEARAAFEQSLAGARRGTVVLEVAA